MSSERTKFKCRFGCSDTFRTREGREYHEKQMHHVWVTPSWGIKTQVFNISHVFDWSRSVANQLNVKQDHLTVDSCY